MAEALKWMNLSDTKVTETLKNVQLVEKLLRIVELAKNEVANIAGDAVATKHQGSLLYHLGTRMKQQCQQHTALVVRCIMNGDIRSEPQLTAAIDYLLSHAVASFDESDFKEACGVGVTVTPQQIQEQVHEVIEKYKTELLKQRYSFNAGKILGEVKSVLKWANGSDIKKEVDLRVMLLLGAKTAEDLFPKKNQKAAKPKQNDVACDKNIRLQILDEKDDEEGALTIEELMRKKANFHKVGENYRTDGYMVTPKTMELLKKHVETVKGKVRTRFPPEPNGILHIGHAKAINIDFGYAKAHGGSCILRFDDTNPEKEEEKFMRNIEEMVRWLGYTDYKVTHSSDYFDQLYEWALELIKKQKAYVCHQKVDEIRGFEVPPSPWRYRPMEDSLRLFEDMRRGKFAEGEATLRLKTILEEGKVDPVAYRIKYLPHPRTGNKWCIYPTYDYTHCLCDSLENITHSLCTKEFQSRRSSYYWLCNSLDIYCPVQWEYGRLNMYYSVVSKRKIKALIDKKIVSDWDDPRLFTLTALRRRGIPPEAINIFIAKLGLTTAQTFIDPQMLDAVVRNYLNITAPRSMAVLEPLKVTIANYDELLIPNMLDVPDFPNESKRTAKHKISCDRVIYVERTDFREENSDKNYRRLSKKGTVGLKYLGLVISFVEQIVGENGSINEVIVKAEKLTPLNKPKAFIHWVSKPIACEVRLYDRLFKHGTPEDPAVVPEGFLSDCNEDSVKIIQPVFIDRSIANSKVYDRYQFERTGFFSVDPDSVPGKLIFNRTVGLKEDIGKCAIQSAEF